MYRIMDIQQQPTSRLQAAERQPNSMPKKRPKVKGTVVAPTLPAQQQQQRCLYRHLSRLLSVCPPPNRLRWRPSLVPQVR